VTVVGNRRLAGAREAGWKSLEVVLAKDMDDIGAIEDAIIHENIHRQDLPLLLEAEMFERKMARDGLSARGLADSIGKSHAYVNQRLSLKKLLPGWQALVKSGDLGLKEARRIAPLNSDKQQVLLTAWPHLTNLVPAARESFLDGALNHDDVKQLAALPSDEQRREVAERLRGGNRVSTPETTSGDSSVANHLNNERSEHEPDGRMDEHQVDDAPRPSSTPTKRKTAASSPHTPAAFVELIRARLTQEQIKELLTLLAEV
jgi:ParB-like chromosome segregation protein Spo0J